MVGLAQTAVKGMAEHAGSALWCGGPRAHEPRRPMTHMLVMAAFQLGHPVFFFVLMKTDDAALHGDSEGLSFALLGSSSQQRSLRVKPNLA